MTKDSTSNATVNSRGVGLLTGLTIIFVVLKLNPGGYLDSAVEGWSWWLVFAPLWGVWALILLFAVIAGIAYFIAYIKDKRRESKFRKAREQRTRSFNRF